LKTDAGERWLPSDVEAVEVAQRLLHDGMAMTPIARALWGKSVSAAAGIGRVLRLLEYAYERGIVQIEPPRRADLASDLAARFTNVEFAVINDAHYRDHELWLRALHAAAAERTAAHLEAAFARKAESGSSVVIGNAGGPSVWGAVQALARLAGRRDPARFGKLLSLSLNAAAIPENYYASANVAAVHLAEMHRGRHLAVSLPWPERIAAEYEEQLNNLDIVLCAAGAATGLLFGWFRKHYPLIAIPPGAVGDLCLIPLLPNGQEAEIDPKSEYCNRLLPQPGYDRLARIAHEGGKQVIVVLSTPAPESWSLEVVSKSLPAHLSKLAIARAILARGLANTMIIGSRMAEALLGRDSDVPASDAPVH